MKFPRFLIFFFLFITFAISFEEKCWSSTYDDRRTDEALSSFKAKCASWSSTKYSNGYDAFLNGCGYQESRVSCCCSLKPWPKEIEDVLLDEEKDLPANSKNLLGNVKLYLANISSKIQVYSLSSLFKKLMVGDIAAIIGNSLVAGNLTFLSLDKLKENFLEPLQKTFSRYLPAIGKTELLETLSKTKGFSFGAKILDKVGLAYGIVIPIGKKQIEDLQKNLSFRKHVSDLVSEFMISYSTIIISTEIGAEIGALYFGGGAIPGAVAGFTVGVALQLLGDGLIKFEGKTPADFIRDGYDILFKVEDQSTKLNEF
jgi:hypothetical protein